MDESIETALAARGVPGTRWTLPSSPLDPDAWAALQDQVVRQRLWGLLGDAVACGDLAATERQATQAETRHRMAMDTVLELEALALSVVGVLAGAGIPTRLLKGPAVAHLDERDPALRCFADVDLLVRRQDLPTAIEVLRLEGFRRDLPERRPGFDRRFAKEASLKGPRGREVDLHASLALGAFGLAIDMDDLWAGTDDVALAGEHHSTLDGDRRLVHAAYAAVLGDPAPRLVLLRDVALLLTGNQIDLDEVIAIATRWRGRIVLATAISLAAERFDAAGWPLLDWARGYDPTGWERRALRAYRALGGSNTKVLLSGALAPLPICERAAYLRAFLWPARSYVHARRTSGRPAEGRTAIGELLRRR